ncbi:unnamed protein product [Agarophyton chilense]
MEEQNQTHGSETDTFQPLSSYQAFLKSNNVSDNENSELLYQVYQDLLRIRKWTNLRVCHGAPRVYLAGTSALAFDSVFGGSGGSEAQLGDRTQAVIPLSAWETLSPDEMHALCDDCVHPESGEKLRCVTLAIVDDDSTTAYYRMVNTWEEIVDARWKSTKVKTEEGGGTEERDESKVLEESDSSPCVDSDD